MQYAEAICTEINKLEYSQFLSRRDTQMNLDLIEVNLDVSSKLKSTISTQNPRKKTPQNQEDHAVIDWDRGSFVLTVPNKGLRLTAYEADEFQSALVTAAESKGCWPNDWLHGR